jgi:protein gp37
MIFVNSMSDLFHEKVPDRYIEEAVKVMLLARWHTFQILTKRAGRLRSMLQGPLEFAAPAKNIWWGVSVENKRDGLPRIKQLQSAPAVVRFLSVEPLLEDIGTLNLEGISWVIVGGESGPHSRPMRAEWVTSVREQCERSGVAFFFKQWGGARKKLAGRTLEGKTYSEFPTRHEVGILPNPQRMLHIQRYSSMPAIDVPLGSLIG